MVALLLAGAAWVAVVMEVSEATPTTNAGTDSNTDTTSTLPAPHNRSRNRRRSGGRGIGMDYGKDYGEDYDKRDQLLHIWAATAAAVPTTPPAIVATATTRVGPAAALIAPVSPSSTPSTR